MKRKSGLSCKSNQTQVCVIAEMKMKSKEKGRDECVC